MSKNTRSVLMGLALLIVLAFNFIYVTTARNKRCSNIAPRTIQLIPEATPYKRYNTVSPYSREQGVSSWTLVN